VVIQDGGFYLDAKKIWIDFPNTPTSSLMRHFYLMQLCFNFSNLVCHFFLETRRKDFWQMLLHHVATSILIGLSYAVGGLRIGAVILVTQDLCDVIFEFGKLFVYTKNKIIADAIFVVMICTWVYTRLYLFPFQCLPIAYWPSSPNPVPLHNVFKVLLAVIAVLNYFWFYLMIKVLFRRVIFGDKLEDTREKGHSAGQNGKTFKST